MDISRFALIDELIAADDGLGWARYRSTVPQGGPLFEAHFPGRPLLPGVLQLEMMAQAGGLLILKRRRLEQMPLLAGVEKARFRREVTPGRRLTVQAALDREAGRLVAFTCEITDAEGPVASAVLRLALADFPNAAARAGAAALLGRIGYTAEPSGARAPVLAENPS